MALKFLWITPKHPFPADDGAKRATCSLISSISKLGGEIDLISLSDGSDIPNCEVSDQAGSLGLRSLQVLSRAKSPSKSRLELLKYLLSSGKIPVTLYPYSKKALASKFHLLLSRKDNYDYIVYDGLHPAAHSAESGKFARNGFSSKIIYRAHNRESDLWFSKAAATSNFIKRALLLWQASKVKRFEDSLVASSDFLAPVSDLDLQRFQTTRSHSLPGFPKAMTVPIGMSFGSSPLPLSGDSTDKEIKLLFFGKLDWAPNREGLTWFLKEVWPELMNTSNNLSLTIAGSGDGAWLAQFKQLAKISLLGWVKDSAELFEKCDALIVPLFIGSGTRVKIIEAASIGRAAISTSVGAAGLDLVDNEQFVRADSKEAWIKQLTSLSKSKLTELGINAFAALREDYAEEVVARKFLHALENV